MTQITSQKSLYFLSKQYVKSVIIMQIFTITFTIYFILQDFMVNHIIELFINMKEVWIIALLVYFTIQQCPASGIDYTANQLSNGNFETPSIGVGNPPVQYPGGIGAWTCTTAEIGNGISYNTNWGATQVAALDTGSNQGYTQSFSLTQTKRFFFSVSFAKRQGFSPSTSGLRIYWNGKNVAQEPTATDDLVHSITLNLTSIVGINTIIIQAMGHDDHQGTTIDDVGIYPITQFHRQMINGVCSCSPGYFDNGLNYQCVPCSDMDQLCLQCSFIPDSSLWTASCLTNVTYGSACAFGAFTCTLCQSGYYISQSGLCQPLQIIPNFYEPNWQLKYIPCDKFKGNIQISIPFFSSLQYVVTNNTNVTITQNSLTTTSTLDVYKISLEASYIGDISTETITFIVYFTNTSAGTDTVATIIKMTASDIPLIYYDEKQCTSKENVADFATALAAVSYFILFFSLISLKIVGLELFGVLQLAYFSLASHDKVNLYLEPLLKWKYLNGYNVETTQPSINVSSSINLIGYKDNFFFNINFMFALLILDLIIGFIVYQIAKKKQNQKLMMVSMYILKLGFITLFLFNSLNLSFSIGTHFKYANPSTTEHYILGTIGAILGICIYIFAAAYMQFVKEGQFGQYKNKFKRNCVNKFYIPLSIIYRFVLGVYIAEENQWYLSTLIVLGVSIAFIMFNIVNLPFKKAYQNYRANLCHFSQLIILIVSNYYRSMKRNLNMNEKGHIHWPAILELVVICICIFVSFFCLLYEIFQLIKKYRAQRKSKQKVDSDSQAKVISNDNNTLNKTQQQIANFS